MSTRSRDVFPLRFKRAATRDALKHFSDQTGVAMTDIAERAIEHELVLQGADLERRLEETLEVVRGYSPARDAAAHIDAAATGEVSGLDPFQDVHAAHESARSSRSQQAIFDDPCGVLAAFNRG